MLVAVDGFDLNLPHGNSPRDIDQEQTDNTGHVHDTSDKLACCEIESR